MDPYNLPFEVLGQVAPILAWVEGEPSGRLPSAWTASKVPFSERERGWLLQEMPTYSYDTVDEIVRGARKEHRARRGKKPVSLPYHPEERSGSLRPPSNYDLVEAFRALNRHFFVWNGTEPSIRNDCMEDLHELAVRMPAGHIVRHAHARVVSEGVLDFDDALNLPELVTLLPTNSFGMRGVARRGLSESHLHLTAVVSAEENWANSLLRPLSTGAIRGESEEEKRLLVLTLLAGRVLAIAVWMSLEEKRDDFGARPMELLRMLDRVYFARTPADARVATQELEARIHEAAYGRRDRDELRAQELERQYRCRCEHEEGWPREGCRCEDGETCGGACCDPARGASPGGRCAECCEEAEKARRQQKPKYLPLIQMPLQKRYSFLRRWISPTSFRTEALRRGQGLPGNVAEKAHDRHRLVHQLHLAAHLRLVELSEAHPEESDARLGKKKGRWSEKKTRAYQDPRRYFLHNALFRYLVCRTHHWQLGTQQSKTTGLRHFRKYYSSRQRKISDLPRIEEADLVFDRLRQWRGLRVLEGRVSPPARAQDLAHWILAYARPEDRRIEKFGLVVHFIKEREQDEDPSFSHGAESPTPRLRWGRRRRIVREEGLRLYRLLRRPTPVVPFIVGIDAANLELETPPEVFAPVFRFLREYPISLPSENRRFSPYVELEDSIRKLANRRVLGMTYHVGEDFRHLLSGLRAICEVVEFLGPRPGDRLGHGTALALDPKDWLENNGYQAVMPKMEWLDTLVWVHHFLGPGDNVVGKLALEDRIQRLSWDIYSESLEQAYDPLGLWGEAYKLHKDEDRHPRERRRQNRRGLMDWDWSPLTLWDAWTLRQLDPYLVDHEKLLRGELQLKPLLSFTEEARRWYSVQERVVRRVKKTIGSRNAYFLLALYWMSPKVRKAGDEIEVVDMREEKDDWLELCRHAEERMKKLIHERELVVEANPSSNRIIGPMARYGQHHIFNLTLDENNRLSRQVRVSVNTDNPAVCNTTLAHEYYLLGEILTKRGVPEAEVEKWLEWLRSNGESYNFAKPLPLVEKSPDMRKLVEWLQGIRPGVRGARTRSAKLDEFWCWTRESFLRSRGFRGELVEKEPELLERVVSSERSAERLAKLHERVRELEILLGRS